jgi:hypothetical protein
MDGTRLAGPPFRRGDDQDREAISTQGGGQLFVFHEWAATPGLETRGAVDVGRRRRNQPDHRRHPPRISPDIDAARNNLVTDTALAEIRAPAVQFFRTVAM